VRRNLNAILAVAVAVGGLRAARAAEVTRVVSGSRGPGDLVDLHLSLGWTHESRSASIKREIEGQATAADRPAQRSDLQADPRRPPPARGPGRVAGFQPVPGVPWSWPTTDRWTSIARAAGSRPPPACVDENNATILRDGILAGRGRGQLRPGQPPPAALPAALLDGVSRAHRKGLEYLALGASWGAASTRIATSPTPPGSWRLEARLAVGGAMRFDPQHAGANTAAGPGAHQFVLSSIFSRRLWTLEP
jgi:hypothetical protein